MAALLNSSHIVTADGPARREQWQTWLQLELSRYILFLHPESLWVDNWLMDRSDGDIPTSSLEGQCREVVKLWDKFSSSFPQLERPGSACPNVPTISTLQQEVLSAEQAWTVGREAGWGKAKNRVFTFIETMNNHSYLFSFIPQGDRYVSLFAGVISSIVKVSH